MPSVYVVSQGSYSDRGVVAVFTDKAKADALVAAIHEGDVEEFETDVIVPPERGHKLYEVESEPFSLAVAPPKKWCTDRLSRGTDERPVRQSRDGVLRVDVWARDDAHAVKIAADKFREYRAMQPSAATPAP